MGKKIDRQILQLISNSSFRKWCLGTASKEEKQRWQMWAAKNVDRQQSVETAKNIILELEEQKPIVPKGRKYRNWERLNQRIQVAQKATNTQAGHRKSMRSSFGWIATAAASILLLVASFLTLQYTDLIKISAPEQVQKPVPQLLTTNTDYGEQKIITLDSGTQITLNANSSLSYRDGWVFNDTVNVKLEGEAYFDVVPRSANEGPIFRVETTDGHVHVLGTRFVVNTWNQKTKVILEKGKVAIQQKREEKAQKKTILQPDELAEFSRSYSDISITNVNTTIYTSWTRGLFVFERAPLTVVADRIEKIFGKEVQIADQALMREKVSGAVENDDLEVLLSALSQTLQISVEKKNDTIIFRDDAPRAPLKFNTN